MKTLSSTTSFKCRKCGKLSSDLQGAYLMRVNEKGIPGEWECRPVCGADLSSETLLMMAIDGESEGSDEQKAYTAPVTKRW